MSNGGFKTCKECGAMSHISQGVDHWLVSKVHYDKLKRERDEALAKLAEAKKFAEFFRDGCEAHDLPRFYRGDYKLPWEGE